MCNNKHILEESDEDKKFVKDYWVMWKTKLKIKTLH